MITILTFLATAIILLFPRNIMDSVEQAAGIFVENVMPALFPMMILGSFWSRSVRQGYSQTFRCIFLIMFGFVAGSPAAARQLSAAHAQQPLNDRQIRPLLCITGVMSPLFFTGSLAMRTGPAGGWLMLLCHWGGALLTGSLCHAIVSRRENHATKPQQTAALYDSPTRFSAGELTSAVAAAANALLAVLGAMMLFAAASAIVQSLLQLIMPAILEKHPSISAALWALLEIGGGAFALMDCFDQPPLWLLCALCSFGGLSIWLQNLLFVGKMIRPAELLGWRILHGAASGLLCYLLQRLTGISAVQQTFAGLTQTVGSPEPLTLVPALLLIIPALYPRRKRAS